jgi:hypothetical protein
MAVGTYGASLPGIPDSTCLNNRSISKSLPIPSKEFLRKCLAQLAFSDRDKPPKKEPNFSIPSTEGLTAFSNQFRFSIDVINFRCFPFRCEIS